jgi:hypothetical protein
VSRAGWLGRRREQVSDVRHPQAPIDRGKLIGDDGMLNGAAITDVATPVGRATTPDRQALQPTGTTQPP